MLSGNMDWHNVASGLVIFSGAAILLGAIIKIKELFAVTALVPERNRRFILWSLRGEIFLLLFFLAGYLVVAGAFFLEYAVIGKFFVSLVFFFGAVFVLIGTALTARILVEVQDTLQGLLPICMSCKKIRREGALSSDQEGWSEIETYISGRTQAKFSHGLCPRCLTKARGRKKAD